MAYLAAHKKTQASDSCSSGTGRYLAWIIHTFSDQGTVPQVADHSTPHRLLAGPQALAENMDWQTGCLALVAGTCPPSGLLVLVAGTYQPTAHLALSEGTYLALVEGTYSSMGCFAAVEDTCPPFGQFVSVGNAYLQVVCSALAEVAMQPAVHSALFEVVCLVIGHENPPSGYFLVVGLPKEGGAGHCCLGNLHLLRKRK